MQKGTRLILALILATAVGFGCVVALVIDTVTNVPDFREMRSKVVVPIKLANKEKSEKEMGPKSKGWVPISQLSNHVLMAVIASEDTSFFSHKGVDYHELKEAVKKDWEEKKWARGGSTITQQVIKNVYLGRQKTLWRKFKEFFWAGELEKTLTKSEILNFYVNMVEWGPGIYGIREASEHYFNVHPSLVTAKQAAFLAILLPSPVKYHSYFVKKELTPWAEKRVGQVLRVMNRMGFVDEETYKEALAEKLWGTTGQISVQTAESEVSEEEPEEGIKSLLSAPVEKLKRKAEEQAAKTAAEPSDVAIEDKTDAVESPEVATRPESEKKDEPEVEVKATEEKKQEPNSESSDSAKQDAESSETINP